uniref:Uncharacterized protein n=1 Tax=Romanomermis culicivorax TaxID=13658 RepID=A0A915HYE4_ROMCU
MYRTNKNGYFDRTNAKEVKFFGASHQELYKGLWNIRCGGVVRSMKIEDITGRLNVASKRWSSKKKETKQSKNQETANFRSRDTFLEPAARS